MEDIAAPSDLYGAAESGERTAAVKQNGHNSLLSATDVPVSSKKLVKTGNGETWLYVACKLENSEVAGERVQEHASTEDNVDWVPLCEKEQQELVEVLLAQKLYSAPVCRKVLEYDLIEQDSKVIRVYLDKFNQSYFNKLKSLQRYHKNLHIESKFNSRVTHLLVENKPNFNLADNRLNVLKGIVRNLWILSLKWVIDSNKRELASFEEYEIASVRVPGFAGPRNGRLNRYKGLPRLFSGCYFFFRDDDIPFPCDSLDEFQISNVNLQKLITEAGGIVLDQPPNPESIIAEKRGEVPYHANRDGKLANCSHYIIWYTEHKSEPRYDLPHLKTVSHEWPLYCIENHKICELYW